MSFKPQRTFVGSEGEYSRDYSGPEAIKSDLESLMRMFDPNSTHSDGSQGGITFDNLSISFEDSAMSEKVGSADIEGLTAANNVYAQLVAIVQILTSKSNLSASDTLKFIGGTLNEEASNAQAIVDSLYNLVIDRYTKEQSDANLKARTDNLIKALTYNDETGVLTATYADGSSADVFDLNVEKIPASIAIVEEGNSIYIRITNTDGTYTQSDVTSLLTQYSFADTDTVAMTTERTADDAKTVKAAVKDGSITRAKLGADILGDLTTSERNAGLSAESASSSAESASVSAGLASTSAIAAENHADDARGYADSASTNAAASSASASTAGGYATSAKSYAMGGTGTRSGENTDNAKYYSQQAKASKDAAESAASNTTSTILANVDNKVREAEATISGAVGAAENAISDIASAAETEIGSAIGNARTELQTYVSSAEDSAETAEYWAKQAEESAGGDFVTNTVFNTHKNATDNPHAVTKSQVGLGNVDNTSDANKPISTATQNALNAKADLVDGKVKSDQLPSLDYATTTEFNAHKNATNNPHSVTKAHVGLGNVDNTSDMDKPVSTATQKAIEDAVAQIDVTEQLKETVRFDKEVTTIIGDDLKADNYTVEFTEDVVDNTPTENSPNLVTSGGVYKAIADIDVGEQLKETVRFDGDVSTVLAEVLKSDEYVIEFSEEEVTEYPPFVEDFSTVKNVVFGDGIITETYSGGISKVTTFNEDGSITEELTTPEGTIRKKTTFNEDGTISEVIL